MQGCEILNRVVFDSIYLKKGGISIFIRGGNWNNTTNAGVLSLNLNNGATNANTNIGFRCVFRVIQ